MNEKIKKLQEMIKNDPKLLEKAKVCKKPEDVKKFAKDLGVEFNDEDFQSSQKLNAKELEAVTGGNACACVTFGRGRGGGLYCGCFVIGFGSDTIHSGGTECVCVEGGAGWLEYDG